MPISGSMPLNLSGMSVPRYLRALDPYRDSIGFIEKLTKIKSSKSQLMLGFYQSRAYLRCTHSKSKCNNTLEKFLGQKPLKGHWTIFEIFFLAKLNGSSNM